MIHNKDYSTERHSPCFTVNFKDFDSVKHLMTVKSCHTASFDRPKLQFKPYLKLPVPIPDEEKKLT